MASYLKWYGPKVYAKVMFALGEGTKEGVKALQWDIRRRMGPPGPNEPEHRPGSSPHRQTDKYYDSIKTDGPEIKKSVASSVVYSDIRRVIYFEKSKIPRTNRPTFKLAQNSPTVNALVRRKFAQTASKLL